VSGWGLSYGDVFEEWEVINARRAVARFQATYPWLRGIDFEDLLQECLFHWYLKRKGFQEGKGASIKTYMRKVLEHKLQDILKEQLCDRRKIVHFAKSLDEPIDEGDATLGDVIPAEEAYRDIDIHIDVEFALSGLSPSQRRICRLLSQGYSERGIAKLLGKPRSIIRSEMRRIREIFSEKGFKDL
jgi:RNA polymerase sigma factor (sigma-70 family)